MSQNSNAARFARFGVFEADLQERQLYRNGLRVKLQNQPFEVLTALLERSGETVTTEELSRRMWPEGTYVEFEHSLSTAVLKIRRVLGDSAENPRFIETIPRHGYRFIAPVHMLPEDSVGTRERQRSSWSGPWAVAVLAPAALAAATVSYLALRTEVPANLPAPQPLTSSPGWEMMPSFSPDGTHVAYGWCEEGTWVLRGNCDIFVKSVGAETSLRLTEYPWVDTWPAWSPDGRFIAFLRIPPEGMASYHVVPAVFGRERKVAETFSPMPPPLFGTGIAWFPDASHIAIVVRAAPDGPRSLSVLSVEDGARRALTSAPSQGMGDTAVAVAPDGRRIAFVRTGLSRTALSDIYLLELAQDLTVKGEPRRLVSDQAGPVSLAWMPDGDAIVFSSAGSLWRLPVSGRGTKAADRLAFAGGQASDPALSRYGRRLAYSQRRVRQDVWRVRLADSRGADGPPTEVIASTREDGWPQYSPDATRIAFSSDRSGIRQLYVCNADGSDLVQLTRFAGWVERGYPGWSPDGSRLVFAATVEGNTDIFEIGVQAGAPRRLTTGRPVDYHPQWSRDGKCVYFASDRTGELQIWKMPAGGGEAVRVTEHGGEGPFESPDGRYLYYAKPGTAGTESLWRVPLGGGHENLVLPEVFRGNFALWREAIFFIPQRDVDRGCHHLQRLDLATGETAWVIDLKDIGGGLSVSADGRSLLYTTVVHTSGDLVLVENFR